MQIAGKVIIVTGGASGIGRGLCERFAREAAKHVCVADLDEVAGQEVAAAVGGSFIRCDVGDEAQVKQLIAQTESQFGPVDLYCSNAGVGLRDSGGHVAGTNDDAWTKSWQVNLMAHVYAARALLPGMLERGAGYFLITASAAGLLHQVGSSAYSVTKHGAVAFAESLAITHGDQGIGVSVLCPQGVWTNMTRWVKSSPKGGDAMQQPADVAEVVVQALAENRFLVLSHPVTKDYMQNKARDYDAWIGGMRRYFVKLRESQRSR
jgi:NAD(P)-dependent dehydrogenase (short-subunit alcohol dehydrogenase family)